MRWHSSAHSAAKRSGPVAGVSRSPKYGRNLDRADVKRITCMAFRMSKRAISATC